MIMTSTVRDSRGTSPGAGTATTPSRDSSGGTHYGHWNRKAGHCCCHVSVLPLVLRVALLTLGANGRGVGKSIRGPCSSRRWRCRWVVSPGSGPSPARVSGPREETHDSLKGDLVGPTSTLLSVFTPLGLLRFKAWLQCACVSGYSVCSPPPSRTAPVPGNSSPSHEVDRGLL